MFTPSSVLPSLTLGGKAYFRGRDVKEMRAQGGGGTPETYAHYKIATEQDPVQPGT